MASLLRQIVAGPRAKHPETGLDLCYVTENIIATSGPSQAYPQRAYRNPLDRLVAFLDASHGDRWAIWEFRAEGTGYPDDAVYGRIRHYPWPDHHPPPFRLLPMIMAGMRSWLAGGPLHQEAGVGEAESVPVAEASGDKKAQKAGAAPGDGTRRTDRVVVVHCKAGKGRSGTVACSYLVSECGWRPEDALARFTERRMRPKAGAGVSVPSQLRWIGYVDRWMRGGKRYADRPVEIVEVHVWGLRHGVKLSVEGFADEGKRIAVLHTFSRAERLIVEGDAPGGGGMVDLVSDMAGYALSPTQDNHEEIGEDAGLAAVANGGGGSDGKGPNGTSLIPGGSKSKELRNPRTPGPIRNTSKSPLSRSLNRLRGKNKTTSDSDPTSPESPSSTSNSPQNQSAPSLQMPRSSTTFASDSEPGGMAVIFKPESPIRVPNSDVNISVERRNKTPASMGLTMVTAVAHVWFNAFFEGRGPEREGLPDESGIFEIGWDRMDGIKGSSQKGTRAADRIAVVWKVAGSEGPEVARGGEKAGIREPGEGEVVPQVKAADWQGANRVDPDAHKVLGLRAADPSSAAVSKASSVESRELGGPSGGKDGADDAGDVSDAESLNAVKTSGPGGEDLDESKSSSAAAKSGDEEEAVQNSAAAAENGFIVE